jgi:outer membrane protein
MRYKTLFFLVFLFTSNVCAKDSKLIYYNLDQLLKKAVCQADQIKYKFEEINLARIYSNIARAALLPKINTQTAYSRFWKELLDQPKWIGTWGISISQSFTLNGKEFFYYRISELNRKQIYYDLYRLTETYLFNIVQAYYNVLKTQKSIEITEANVRRLMRHQQAVADRLSVNEVAKTALYRAKAELSDAQTENKRAMNANRIASATLARMVCIPNTFEIAAPESHPVSKISLEKWIKQGLENRTELKQLVVANQMAGDRIKVANGAYWPSVSFEAQYYDSKDSTPQDPDDNISGTVSLNYSFFDGGIRSAEVSEARIEKKKMKYIIQDTTRNIALEIETAYLEQNTQLSLLESLKDQLNYSRETFEAVTSQFRFGMATSVDVMDANTLLLTSEQQLSEVMYDIQFSQIKLDYASGVFLKDFAKRSNLTVDHIRNCK